MSLSDDSRYLRGGPVAQRIIASVREDAAIATAEGFPPKLVSITVGDTDAVDVYVRNQRAKAKLAGIGFEERRFAADITAGELEAAIHGLNADPRVTGIIIQRPVPAHIPVRTLQAAVHPLKDVEGMHPPRSATSSTTSSTWRRARPPRRSNCSRKPASISRGWRWWSSAIPRSSASRSPSC